MHVEIPLSRLQMPLLQHILSSFNRFDVEYSSIDYRALLKRRNIGGKANHESRHRILRRTAFNPSRIQQESQVHNTIVLFVQVSAHSTVYPYSQAPIRYRMAYLFKNLLAKSPFPPLPPCDCSMLIPWPMSALISALPPLLLFCPTSSSTKPLCWRGCTNSIGWYLARDASRRSSNG